MTKRTASLFLAAVAFAVLADDLPPRQRVLTVDDAGRLNSTNAIATQAELAAVAASNQISRVELAASQNGYREATNLLAATASSIVAQSVVGFYSLELTSFDAAVAFDESTAKLKIIGVEDLNETSTVQGVPVGKWRVRFAFNQDLQSVQPYLAYVPVLNGTPRDDWDNLAPDFVSAPVRETGTYTDGDGNQYTYLYYIDAWLPSEPAGFTYIRVPNDAALADGATLDLPNGVKGGQTATVTWGGKTLVFTGGVLTGVE